MDLLKFEIGSTPIKITRMILLLLFYVSLVKKPNIYLVLFILFSFIESFIIYENKMSFMIASSVVLLSRSFLLFYSFIKWVKIEKTNFLYAFIVPILIGTLFFTMSMNNVSFTNMLLIVNLCCQTLLLIIIIKALISFFKDQKKGNTEFLIGTVIILLVDLFYIVQCAQDVSISVNPNTVRITSVLYSIAFYMIIISHKKRIEEN